MRATRGILLLSAGLLLAAPVRPAGAQAVKTEITMAQFFAHAKPGNWVSLEGLPQADQSLLCAKAKTITGAVGDGDWAIKGQVASVDAANRLVTIGRLRVRFSGTPKFKSPMNTVRAISDVKPGMYVKVEGNYENGFAATKLDDQTAEVAKKPGSEKKFSHVGKVERVDPSKKMVVVMGYTYILHDGTQITSVVK